MTNEEHQEVELEQENDNEEVEEVEEQEEVDESTNEEESTEDEVDWKAEALKYKAIADRNKKKSNPVNSNINSKLQDKAETPDDEVVSRLSNLELAEKKRQFGYEHGLSPSQTDKVFALSQNPSKETLKDPFVKAGLDAIRRQERLANNTPSTSAKSGTIDRKALKEATPEEKQKAFEKYMKSKVQ